MPYGDDPGLMYCGRDDPLKPSQRVLERGAPDRDLCGIETDFSVNRMSLGSCKIPHYLKLLIGYGKSEGVRKHTSIEDGLKPLRKATILCGRWYGGRRRVWNVG